MDFREVLGVAVVEVLLRDQPLGDVRQLVVQLGDEPVVLLQRPVILLQQALVGALVDVQGGLVVLELAGHLLLPRILLPQQPVADPLLDPPLRVHRVLLVDLPPQPAAQLLHLLEGRRFLPQLILEGGLLLLEVQVFVVVEGGLVLEVGQLVDLELEVREQLVVLELELPVEAVQVADLALEHQPQGYLLRVGALHLLVGLLEHAAVQLQPLVLQPQLLVLPVDLLVLLLVLQLVLLDHLLLALQLRLQPFHLGLVVAVDRRNHRLEGALRAVLDQDAEHLPEVLLHLRLVVADLGQQVVEADRVDEQAFEYPGCVGLADAVGQQGVLVDFKALQGWVDDVLVEPLLRAALDEDLVDPVLEVAVRQAFVLEGGLLLLVEAADVDRLLLPVDESHKGSVFGWPFLVSVGVVGVVALGDEVLRVVGVIIVGNVRFPLVPIAVGRDLSRVSLLRQHRRLLGRSLLVPGLVPPSFGGESARDELLRAVGLQRLPAHESVDVVALLGQPAGQLS